MLDIKYIYIYLSNVDDALISAWFTKSMQDNAAIAFILYSCCSASLLWKDNKTSLRLLKYLQI
jgi:hypothetical protein